MPEQFALAGDAPVLLLVTLRGTATVAMEVVLELSSATGSTTERRWASGAGLASVVFDLDEHRLPMSGRLLIIARRGEAPLFANVEVREGGGHVWARDLELRQLGEALELEFFAPDQGRVGGDSPTASPGFTIERARGTLPAARVEPPASAALVEEAPKDRVYGVWFGTNREPVVDDGQVVDFSAKLAEAVSYGHCEVFVPRAHRLGATGSPWYRRLFRGDDRLTVRQVSTLGQEDFWQRVSEQLAAAGVGRRHAVVFIHGYNVEFLDAAIRAAQLGCDLKIEGPMAFFSWASRGTTLRYTNDEATIEESEHAIEAFLVDFATKLKPEAVHIIAHSMGNRAVLRMVDRVVGRAAAEVPVRFGHLVLAAPDVTPGLFRNVAEGYRRIAERTTIYVSSRDRALALSNVVHGRPRVGDSTSEVFVVDGIDTVVASEIDAGFLGHFAPGAREVLTDVHELLHSGTPAAERFGMRVVEAGTTRFFVIQE